MPAGFPDLADFPDFPTFSEDGEFASLASQESMFRQNDTAEFLNQFTVTEIEDANGARHQVLATPSGIGAALAAWRLYEEKDKWLMALGRLFDDPGDLSTPIEILGSDTAIDPSPGKFVWLEIVASPTWPRYSVTLKTGPKWTGYPDAYTLTSVTSPTAVARLDKARILLASFQPGTLPDNAIGEQISKTVHATYVRRSPDLLIQWGPRTFDGTTQRRALVPVLTAL